MPTSTGLPVDRRRDAAAGDRVEIGGGRRAVSLRSLAASTIGAGQRMLAVLLDGRGQPQQFVFGSTLPSGWNAFGQLRPALGQRAGLVDDERVDFSSVSSTSASLIKHALLAPRPTPTMIDIGVARPRAQGQAMISTATAFTKA